MSVLLGATFFRPKLPTFTTSDGTLVQPMEQITPNATTPPASFNTSTGSGANSFVYQGGGTPTPAIPNPNDANKTIKADSTGVFDSKPQNATETYMDKVKKFAPYIIGGGILLFLVMRRK
jgi:hypothetical protein